MTTHQTHHPHTHTQGPGKELAMRWLARQLRWERLLDELRAPAPSPVTDEEQAA